MPRKSSTWTVYALKDPRTDAVAYVGVTFNLLGRMRTHERECQREKNSLKRWLIELGNCGLIPTHEVLESGEGNRYEAERRWIAKMRSSGMNLTNSTDGGAGRLGSKHSAESRRKRSESSKGKKRSSEFSEKMRQVARQRPPEYWIAVAERNRAKKGLPMSLEARAKMSNAKKGKTWSAARRLAFEANGHPGRRRPHSEESKAKMSRSRKIYLSQRGNARVA